MNSKKTRKKILVIGFVRTGTHLIKIFITKIIKSKRNYYQRKGPFILGLEKVIYLLLKIINFLFIHLGKKKVYSSISKRKILNLKILSTHELNTNLFDLFKEYKIIITIRSPLDTINSIVNYVTKKNIIKNTKKKL